VVRTLVPINQSGGQWSGVLTGGANSFNAGQRITYQFDVPGSQPSLNIGVRLRDANYNIQGYLTDPHGMPLDVQSTATRLDLNGLPISFGPTLQLFRATPDAGRWTLSLLVFGPIDGTHLTEPFSASIDFRPAQVTARGLPNSPATVLAAGKTVSSTVQITNTGNSIKDFFADARLRGRQLQALLGSGQNNVELPLSLNAQPNWLVPTHTNQLIVLAQGSQPIVLEVSAANGDPDRIGFSVDGANTQAAVISSKELFPGFFFALPELKGPFPNGTTGTVNLAAAAMTNPFDSAVSADSGDLWALAVDPNASYSPLTLAPGQTGTITLTITPDAAVGSVVRGFVDIDTFNLDAFTNAGDEVITLPYTYRVQ
jgi:hypothetical protein